MSKDQTDFSDAERKGYSDFIDSEFSDKQAAELSRLTAENERLRKAIKSQIITAKAGRSAASHWCKNLEGDFAIIQQYLEEALAEQENENVR